jgi:FkbM family methyltransferase
VTSRRWRYLSKIPYYVRALVALAGIATPWSVAQRVIRPKGPLLLRDGSTLRLGSRLDLLVLVECWIDDVYGLGSVDAAPGDLVVDVGAGIGDFAIAAATTLDGVSVRSFEPNPVSFSLAEKNLRALSRSVSLERVAIGNASTYRLRGVARGPLASARAPASRSDDDVVVVARPLDEAVPPGRVALLKIDCEGLEVDVLEGGRNVLQRVDRVVVEYHRHLAADSDRRVAALLAAHGFETRIRPDPYDPALGYVDAWRAARSWLPVRPSRDDGARGT